MYLSTRKEKRLILGLFVYYQYIALYLDKYSSGYRRHDMSIRLLEHLRDELIKSGIVQNTPEFCAKLVGTQ